MKTFRMIGMALAAVLMCVNFAACNNEESSLENPQEPKMCTVSINLESIVD